MVDDYILHVIGILAGILILAGWVEQIYKGYKTKHLRDVSNYLMIFIGAGAVLWSVYGVFVSDVFIIGTNVAAVILMITVLMMKRTYARRSRAAPGPA
ncbi:MAG: hypothetical protein J4F28_02955 [Nitrosopumilaceae archaeon]|nr:hypothetical protein [Nitrosopumilaceae archaeon]